MTVKLKAASVGTTMMVVQKNLPVEACHIGGQELLRRAKLAEPYIKEAPITAFAFSAHESAAPEVHALLDGPSKHLGFVPNRLLGLSNSPASII